MKAEKIRNLTEVELKHQERDLADQLFKLKFQMNMGQTESLKKIRGLRRDIARVQTVLREQELAGTNGKAAKTAEKSAEKNAGKSAAKAAAKATPARATSAKATIGKTKKTTSKMEKK
jgi:large subunit ribosomal protein L29